MTIRLGTILARRHRRPPPTAATTMVSPFFYAHNPASGEGGGYDRSPKLFYWTTGTFTWLWRFGAGFTPSVWPAVRALVDGAPVTGWISPASNNYTFSFVGLPNGHHILTVEIQSNDPTVEVTTRQVLARDFIVNSTGSPLAVQAPWTAVNRFERTYRYLANGHAQITYPGSPVAPTARPLKPRAVTPYTTIQAKSALWVRRVQQNVGPELTRRFVSIPTGDVAIEPEQKFFYTTYTGAGTGLTPPSMGLRDGARGFGNLGPIYKVIVRSSDAGYYMNDPQGRLLHMTTDGQIDTIIGWRVKPGELKAHAGIRGSTYMYGTAGAGGYRPADQTFYDSKWEYLGNWNVPDAQRMQEPRGFALAKRNLDLSIDNRGGREFWVCDTLNNRILYVNARTMDALDVYEQPHFPPPSYDAPEAPTGEADVALFAEGAVDNDEPWDAEINPADGKLYWTCYNTGRIKRRATDGSGAETVLQAAYNPTDAQIGATSGRLTAGGGGMTIAAVRAAYLVDGPVGVASCTRPQAIGFNSDGDLIWVERYTYAIRKLVLATGQVTTLALIPNMDSWGAQDIGMCIDVAGTCGPQDDIFINCYHDSDFRFSKAGVYRERWAWTSGAGMPSGPLNLCDAPAYAFCVGVGNGRILSVGSAAGWQCVEITKRLATDAEPNETLWEQGRDAYYMADESPHQIGGPPMALLHGPNGYGELGKPTMDDLGAMNDSTLDAYALANAIPSGSLAAFRHFVRHNTADVDYSAPPVAEGEFENFMLWDDGVYGPKRGTFSHKLSLHWKYYELTDERGGDWIDSAGTEQGSVPFSSFTAAAATAAGYWQEVDMTALVQKWKTTGKNKGFRIYPSTATSSSSSITVHGRLGANPPQMVVNGTITIQPGMLAAWAHTSLNGINTTLTAQLRKGQAFLGRFDTLLDDLDGVTVTSATLRMWVSAKSMTYPMTGEVYETNPPEIWDGSGTVVLGLADEEGEENLPAHADVYRAGDFTVANLYGYLPPEAHLDSPTKANRSNPSGLFNRVSFDTWGADDDKMTVEHIDDPVVPGTKQVRFGWAPTGLGMGTQALDLSERLAGDPRRAADPASMPQEMFCRIYIMLEDTFYDPYEENIKWGIGWDLRLGVWENDGTGWTPLAGSGQTSGDGRKYAGPDAFMGQNYDYYRGHSLRSYTGASCRNDVGPPAWRNLIAFHQAISHNGPYLHAGRYGYGALSGTEESHRIGNLIPGRAVCIKKDVWYCYEQQIKMNTLTGTPDALGNMTANNDGILRTWLNGILIDEQLDKSWRRHPDFGIQGPWIQGYHGGVTEPGFRGYFRYNHFACGKQYFGPHPGRLA
jgi:hypothetical protein